jgi:UDP-N-acetylglucosamine 3-dehydrogenase
LTGPHGPLTTGPSSSLTYETTVAVVGLGGWGVEHLKAWQSTLGARVVAVCDQDRERARAVAAEYGIERHYRSTDELASAGDVDVASVATTEATRLSTTAPLIDAHIHVLVEKPIALDLVSARRLVQAARQAGVILMPGHILRFDARFATIVDRIRKGSFGVVRSVYARRLIPRGRYFQYQRAHPALMASLHDFDLARWIFGSDPLEVTAYSVERAAPGPADLVWYVLRFPEGALAVVETAFVLPDGAGTWLESETEVISTEGVARVQLPGDLLRIWGPSGHEEPETTLSSGALGWSSGALKDEIAYFLGCVRQGTPPTRVVPEDAVQVLKIALAAVEALESGQPVDLANEATAPAGEVWSDQ